MRKYNKSMIDRIISLIEEDTLTIVDICKMVGISRKVFYEWKTLRPDFAEAIDDALENREEKLRQKARRAMQKKLEGYKQVETKTTYVTSDEDETSMVVKKYVVKEKFCIPETSAITYSMSSGRGFHNQENPEQTTAPLCITVTDEKARQNLEYLKVRVNGK